MIRTAAMFATPRNNINRHSFLFDSQRASNPAPELFKLNVTGEEDTKRAEQLARI